MEVLREIRSNLLGQVKTIDSTIEKIENYEDKLQLLRDKALQEDVFDGVRYVISSLFLRDILNYLSQWDVESIAYLTGVSTQGGMVIDHLVPFDMDVQEVTYVSGDIVSSTQSLCALDDKGFVLAATAHSHPGSGAAATHPSGIDMNHHEMLETSGYKAVGIIMTRDGHFRFYSKDMPFSVQVVGSDVVEVGPNTYKLIDTDIDESTQGHIVTGNNDDKEKEEEHHEKRRFFGIG